MRITYFSDIHLEFGALDKLLPAGDILVLAGDITLIGAFDPDSPLFASLELRKRTKEFIKRCVASFDRVFYVIGNHEAYNASLSTAPDLIRQHFKDVTLLDDKAVALSNDVILVGGTLWTDMAKGKAARHIRDKLNDFDCISYESYERDGRVGIFTPEDAMALHENTKAFISETAKSNPTKTIVVATHHAPHAKGINREHVNDRHGTNAGYFTDMSDFIAAHANIRHWIFGHTHIQTKFKIAQCQVVSNARGYFKRETSADNFDPDKWFEAKPLSKRKAKVTEPAIATSSPVA